MPDMSTSQCLGEGKPACCRMHTLTFVGLCTAQAGFAYMGGKMDDITVVVARVASASEVPDGPLPGQVRMRPILT